MANEYIVQWWFKKFCKGDESLEDEELSDHSLEVDNNHLRAIIETDPFTTTQDIARELNINHSTVIWHLKQIGKMKKLNEWVPCDLTENEKDFLLKCCPVLLYITIMNRFSIGL